jgi:hypothetical protein
MRSHKIEEINHLAPKITPGPVNPMLAALDAFPSNFAAAMAAIPAPVMAPRPAGTWIIDVKRDGAGQMSQMEAKFHETK